MLHLSERVLGHGADICNRLHNSVIFKGQYPSKTVIGLTNIE